MFENFVGVKSFPILLITLVVLLNCLISIVDCELHRTQAAAEKTKDLYCYRCDTLQEHWRERCLGLITPDNQTESMYSAQVIGGPSLKHDLFYGKHKNDLLVKCDVGERMCMVRRVTLIQVKENSTKIWLLQRNCSKTCEPGCIIMGERIKLHACTSCCEKDNCNTGSGAQNTIFKISKINIFFLVVLLFTYYSKNYI